VLPILEANHYYDVLIKTILWKMMRLLFLASTSLLKEKLPGMQISNMLILIQHNQAGAVGQKNYSN